MEEMPVEEKNSGRESRHCYLEVKVPERIQEYWDNGLLMFYVHKTWTYSGLTFHKCWQEGEVVGIHTHVNSGNRLIMLHVGGIGGFLPLCTSHLRG